MNISATSVNAKQLNIMPLSAQQMNAPLAERKQSYSISSAVRRGASLPGMKRTA
jgi:hypothetical protein